MPAQRMKAMSAHRGAAVPPPCRVAAGSARAARSFREPAGLSISKKETHERYNADHMSTRSQSGQRYARTHCHGPWFPIKFPRLGLRKRLCSRPGRAGPCAYHQECYRGCLTPNTSARSTGREMMLEWERWVATRRSGDRGEAPGASEPGQHVETPSHRGDG